MIELKAKEGYYLTQNKEVSDEERMFITAIKGMSINELDWREATQEEKDAFKKQLEENNKIE
jgi:hypothetical protein